MNVKRLIWVLTAALMLCLLAGGALAEEIHKVDIDRVYFEMTPGLVTHKTGTDGNMTLTIDVDRTDWKKVAAHGGIDLRVCVEAPASMPSGEPVTGHYSVCFGGEATRSEMLQVLYSEMEYDSANAAWTVFSNGIGAGVQNGDLLRPESRMEFDLICWGNPRLPNDPSNPDIMENFYRNDAYFDVDNPATASQRYYEELKLEVRFSSSELIYLEVQNARTEWLEPSLSYYGGRNSVVADIDLRDDGQMDMYLKDRKAIADLQGSQYDEDFLASQQLVLKLKAPEGADTLSVNGRQLRVPASRTVEFTDEDTDLVKTRQSNDTVGSAWYSFHWMKGDELLEYGNLQVNIIPADHRLCAFYEDTLIHKPDRNDESTWENVPMQAVPAGRMIVSNQAENCGVRVLKQDGYVKYYHDGTVNASGDPGDVTVSITPPDSKYRFYRIGGAGGSDVYGRAKGRLQGMFQDAYYMDCEKVDGSPIVMTFTTPLMTYQAGPLKVYLQTWEPIRWLSAGVRMILWYETEEQARMKQAPGLVEFICEEEEEFHVPIRVNLVNHEHHITKPVENVTLIKPLGKDWHDWKLNVKITPQKGANAWHYELHLESDTGVLRSIKVSKDDPLVIYMPYPEGYSMASENAFEVYHFEHQQESDDPAEWKFLPLEVLKADKTPFGLRFEVTSLSPFVLSAAEPEPIAPQPTADPQPAPPATGDSSALLLWSVLAVLSLAGMIAVSLRKREA